MQDHLYLTSEEAAAYLRIKERKLYELASTGSVPCSKVGGKWVFPRAAIDRWIEAGMARPAGLSPAEPPPIIGGSTDPLLEWAARRSGSGLALLPEGSEAGLARLAENSISIAAIHLHDMDDDQRANEDAVGARPELHDAVVIGFVRREQGLLVAPGNPKAIRNVEAAVAAGARFGLRQAGAGAQLLLDRLLSLSGLKLSDLKTPGAPYATGQDLALAIRSGEVDCGLATRAVAVGLGLGFAPLEWERFDLVLRRRTYFQPGPQAFFALLQSDDFRRQAETLTGYDLSEAGRVRLNR
jgi:putative molybdopterin biosynthesis protein